jgi:O-antigen/teichoic acid export membrane protein
MVLALAFVWLALRRLGADGFGLVVLVQSATNIAGLATLNLEMALIRFLPEFRSQQQGQAVRSLTWLIFLAKIILAAVAAGLLYFLAARIAASYEQPQLTAAIQVSCLSLFTSTIVTTGKAFCLGWLRPQSRALLSFLRRLFEVSGLLVASTLDPFDVTRTVAVLALADTFAAVAFIALILYYLRQEPRATRDTLPLPIIVRRVWHYCLPLIGVQLTEIAGPNLSKLLVGQLAPPAVLGLYGVARLAVDRLMLLMSQLPLMTVPVLAEKRGTQRNLPRSKPGQELRGTQEEDGEVHRLVGRLLQYQWALGSLANLAIWAAAPVLLLVLGEGDVRPVEPALRLLGFSVLLWAGAAVMHIFFFIYEQTAGILVLNVGQLLLTGLLYYFFVPRWQATGAALADVIAQALELALGLWLVSRWFGFPSGRVIGPLLKQLALIILLVLPVWLWPSAGLPVLAVWAVAAVLVLASYLLRLGVPTAADLEALARQDWGHPLLNQAKLAVCGVIGRYQALLNQI